MAGQPLDTGGLDRIISQLDGFKEIDFTPLMEEWRAIMEEDNEEGILAGLDGWGIPLEPVTYRPNPNKRKPTDWTIRKNDNLSSSAYRELTGPPLAPRCLRQFGGRRSAVSGQQSQTTLGPVR